MSKHEDILKYILSLKVGTKISVRSIANDLNVSEGTAYRAIKDSDTLGIVTTIPRVGTVRIEKVEKKSADALTYAQVVNIVDGTILGGKDGLYKSLNKFVIGAMTEEAMANYISPGSLLIVGNRNEAQKLALNNKAAVLITGGFNCSDEVKRLANEKKLPIISSSFDSFTIASIINKALSENLIKRDIVFAEDIMNNKPDYIHPDKSVSYCRDMMQNLKIDRLPVVDNSMKVVGIIRYKDVAADVNHDEPISKIMRKDILMISPKTTVAYAAHIMVWEDMEVCPVVEGKVLKGIITKQDVIKALEYAAREEQSSETIEDIILKNFNYENNGNSMFFYGKIVPDMLDSVGTASWSSLNMLISTVGIMTLKNKNNVNISVDSISTYFMRPIQMDSMINIKTKIIDIDRNFCKVEVDMLNSEEGYVAKSVISAKILKK